MPRPPRRAANAADEVVLLGRQGALDRARAVLHHDICALDSSSRNIFPGCSSNIRPRLAAQRERSCLACEEVSASCGLPREAASQAKQARSCCAASRGLIFAEQPEKMLLEELSKAQTS